VKKLLFDAADADIYIRVVDRKRLESSAGEDINEEDYMFDITKDPPFRLLYAAEGKHHKIRIVMCHVVLDLQSFFIALGDIEQFLYVNFYHRQVADIEPLRELDIASIMEDSLDAERPQLEEYWKNQLSKVTEVVSVSYPSESEPFSGNLRMIKLQLSQDLMDKIIYLTNNTDLTTVKLLCGMYQLLLYKITQASCVPVVLCTDMRLHFPEFAKRIFLGTNYVPVVTEYLNKYATLKDFISCSSKQIRQSLCTACTHMLR